MSHHSTAVVLQPVEPALVDELVRGSLAADTRLPPARQLSGQLHEGVMALTLQASPRCTHSLLHHTWLQEPAAILRVQWSLGKLRVPGSSETGIQDV